MDFSSLWKFCGFSNQHQIAFYNKTKQGFGLPHSEQKNSWKGINIAKLQTCPGGVKK